MRLTLLTSTPYKGQPKVSLNISEIMTLHTNFLVNFVFSSCNCMFIRYIFYIIFNKQSET
jgi:hypothetical protein